MSHIRIIRGDSDSITLVLNDNGVAVDLTGSTVFFTVKSTIDNVLDDTSAVIKKEVTLHTDPTNGTTVIPLTSTDTNVNLGTYKYDIQIKKADGSIISVPYKDIEIVGDITRRTV